MTGPPPVPDGRGGPHALVADVDDPELSRADRHHLERVLRLTPGDALTVGDGAGRWRPCRFGPRLEPTGPAESAPAPEPALTVGFALVKGDRPDLVVQKLTELGVDRMAPFRADRSVVRWDEAQAARAVQRWRRVARAAVMQCRRLWLPAIDEVADFDELDLAGAVMAVPGGRRLGPDENAVLIGPEGGWTDRELSAAPRHVGLGPHVMRSETAAIAAGALLAARRVDRLPG